MNWRKVHRLILWGVIYFATVFAFGFLLGILRVVFLEPRLGVRWAELIEMPLMLIAIVLTSKWIVRRTRDRFSIGHLFVVGFIALALLLAAELTLVILLRRISISEYIASRDPISGSVYLLMLLIFALAPSLVVKARKPRSD